MVGYEVDDEPNLYEWGKRLAIATTVRRKTGGKNNREPGIRASFGVLSILTGFSVESMKVNIKVPSPFIKR